MRRLSVVVVDCMFIITVLWVFSWTLLVGFPPSPPPPSVFSVILLCFIWLQVFTLVSFTSAWNVVNYFELIWFLAWDLLAVVLRFVISRLPVLLLPCPPPPPPHTHTPPLPHPSSPPIYFSFLRKLSSPSSLLCFQVWRVTLPSLRHFLSLTYIFVFYVWHPHPGVVRSKPPPSLPLHLLDFWNICV